MKFVCIVTAVAAVSVIAADKADEVRWSFEDTMVGKVPEGWSSTKTGQGPGSLWKVIEDKSSPGSSRVLAQISSAGPRPVFNLCVCEEATLTDVDVQVSFRADRGRIDQGGGPVWRYVDHNNYYVARMNPLEDNFRVYRVVKGKRTQLDSADVQAVAGKWHTIRVVHKGDNIQCYLNGKRHLDLQDDTFADPGHVGLWTKADAVTVFDNLTYHGH